MAYTAPYNNNTYIPSSLASAGMALYFFRNPLSFPINRYSEIRDVVQSAGRYLRIAPSPAGTVQYNDLRDDVWVDGANRPQGNKNQVSFEYESFVTQRYNRTVSTGRKAIEQADWAVQDANAAQLAQWLMTGRTILADNALYSSFVTNNSAQVNVASVNGGILPAAQDWSNGTGLDGTGNIKGNIQRSLIAGGMAIWKATYGVITPADLILRITPDIAAAIATSPEVRYILANQSTAGQIQLTGTPEERARISNNFTFGMPGYMYGYRVEVENTVYNPNKPGAADAPTFVNAAGPTASPCAYLLARPGELSKKNEMEDTKGLVNVLSTLICFTYEDVTIEFNADVWHRTVQASATTDIDYVVSSLLSGFCFTNVIPA